MDLRRSPQHDEEEGHDAVPDIGRPRGGDETADIHPEGDAGRDGHHAAEDHSVGRRLRQVGDHERDADVQDDLRRSRDREGVGAACDRVREPADEPDDAEHPGVEESPDGRNAHGPNDRHDRPDDRDRGYAGGAARDEAPRDSYSGGGGRDYSREDRYASR